MSSPGSFRVWFSWLVLLVMGLVGGSVLVFTLCFFAYVVPHGGMW